MAKEIGMDELEWMCDKKTPAIDLEELFRQAASKEFMENFFEEELDEENLMLIKMLNLTARTLQQIHKQSFEIDRLNHQIIEIKTKLDVLEIESRFKHNKDEG